jgi:hypothetical protein
VHAIINALNNCLKSDGSPFSKACYEKTVKLFLDKEQTDGGDDWRVALAAAQDNATQTVCFLCNAYCGSAQCKQELYKADLMATHSGVRYIPVFLEEFVRDETKFLGRQLPDLCDRDTKDFDGFRDHTTSIDMTVSSKHGVPINLDLSSFVCDECRDTRRKDTVCPHCSDWETVKTSGNGPKMEEQVADLGRYIDTNANVL